MSQHRLVNPLVRNIRALKRGALVRQAVRIEEEIKQGMKKPYNEVIDVSRDNPHATGMKPMSFSRQVIASCIYPELIDSDKMPLDVRERAKTLLECIGGSVGCYSDTIGIPIMRDSVSDFLTRRDEGVPSASGNIFITHGSDHGFGVCNLGCHVQSRESMEEIIRFVYEEKLLLFANEDHQDILIGEGCMFISYKKVLAEMGSPFSDAVELASIHSASKGFMGEGGLHGGYLELVNFDPSVQIEFDRLISLLGLPIIGQLALEVMLNPLQPGEPSYEQYQEEIQHIRETLVHNVTRAFEVLDSLPGISCEPINGGASMFPRLHLPHIAIHQAKEEEKLPDFFYCSRLLEQTGLCVCPGSDLGLPEGTYHIRLCIMTSVDTMEEVLRRLGKFHKQFMKDFS
ncbi:alanine aminotransferase 2-like isoform X2 [Gadus morhua]|uniref:alanine aminotransferase 2-like isoform X2 n=1 Tax=Gadus morhua TaxID=8049 RepID=UPI0011B75A49|nr:alanine aminotransferase 2-like isoform X2 [Gadus morhua]